MNKLLICSDYQIVYLTNINDINVEQSFELNEKVIMHQFGIGGWYRCCGFKSQSHLMIQNLLRCLSAPKK